MYRNLPLLARSKMLNTAISYRWCTGHALRCLASISVAGEHRQYRATAITKVTAEPGGIRTQWRYDDTECLGHGSHACKALAAAGYQPVTLDNLGLGHCDFVRWGPLVKADIRDTVTVAQTVERYDIVAAMHFVAFAYVGKSISDPAKYYANNVDGLLALLTPLRCADLFQHPRHLRFARAAAHRRDHTAAAD